MVAGVIVAEGFGRKYEVIFLPAPPKQKKEVNHEQENISTQQYQAEEDPWFSAADEYPGRPGGDTKQKGQGAQAAVGVSL